MATLLFGIYTSLIMTLTPPTPDASGQDGDLLGTAVAEERAVQMPPSVQDFQDLQEAHSGGGDAGGERGSQ